MCSSDLLAGACPGAVPSVGRRSALIPSQGQALSDRTARFAYAHDAPCPPLSAVPPADRVEGRVLRVDRDGLQVEWGGRLGAAGRASGWRGARPAASSLCAVRMSTGGPLRRTGSKGLGFAAHSQPSHAQMMIRFGRVNATRYQGPVE